MPTLHARLRWRYATAPLALILAACGGDVVPYDVVASAIDPPTGSGPTCPLSAANCIYVTSTLASGAGSLTQAITDANATTTKDTILFNIPGAGPHVIGAEIYATQPIDIDGYSQPGAARATDTAPAVMKIVLDGGGALGVGVVVSTDSQVSGLVVRDFSISGIEATGSNITIEGCYVGLDDSGAVAAGNGNIGIFVGGDHITVGGVSPGHRNVVAAATNEGVSLGTCDACAVVGNYIGTDASGTLDRGNGVGVKVTGNGVVTIGGTAPGSRNVISGNGVGLELLTTGTHVEGNFIGTAASGAAALGNIRGVQLDTNAAGNVIGGTAVGAGNLISGNGTGEGIFVGGPQNVIQGNLVGTDVTGTLAISNLEGIRITSAQTVVGGLSAGARNVISGNTYSGVLIDRFPTLPTPSGNVISGNFIGVDVSGVLPLGNGGDGVAIVDGAFNLVGGTGPAAANVIGGNGGDGVAIGDTNAPNATAANIVQGNDIGSDAAGSAALGNAGSGVRIRSGADHWTGGPLAGQGNRISRNGGSGVAVELGSGHGILGNSIHHNGALGIDLGASGVTPNDGLGDADTGANGLQNFPVISAVALSGGNVTMSWTLRTTANTNVRVEFFASAACDASGNGEGQRYLGAVNVTTDATGLVAGPSVLAAAVASGEWVTATATRIGGALSRDTSEFSACRRAPSTSAYA